MTFDKELMTEGAPQTWASTLEDRDLQRAKLKVRIQWVGWRQDGGPEGPWCGAHMLPTESGNCGGVGVARSSVRPGAGGQFPELTDTMQVGGQCRVDRASHCGPGGHLRFLQGWARACLAHTVTSLVFIPEKRTHVHRRACVWSFSAASLLVSGPRETRTPSPVWGTQ